MEESLKHYGVKGMRWGVRRNRNRPGGADGRPDKSVRYKRSQYKSDNKALSKKVKNKQMTRKEAVKARGENLHKYRKDNNKAYNKAYNKATKRGFNEKNARTRAFESMNLNTEIKVAVATYAVAGATIVGKIASASAKNPANIRRGKNIVQAAKRSPIRYVDGKKMTNVVKTVGR